MYTESIDCTVYYAHSYRTNKKWGDDSIELSVWKASVSDLIQHQQCVCGCFWLAGQGREGSRAVISECIWWLAAQLLDKKPKHSSCSGVCIQYLYIYKYLFLSFFFLHHKHISFFVQVYFPCVFSSFFFLLLFRFLLRCEQIGDTMHIREHIEWIEVKCWWWIALRRDSTVPSNVGYVYIDTAGIKIFHLFLYDSSHLRKNSIRPAAPSNSVDVYRLNRLLLTPYITAKLALNEYGLYYVSWWRIGFMSRLLLL